MFEACRSKGEPDYWKAVAVCSNVDDDEEREDCFADIAEERREAGRLCHVQREARHALCDALGEDRYDPDFDPNGVRGYTSLGFSGPANLRWIYNPAINRMPSRATTIPLIAGRGIRYR